MISLYGTIIIRDIFTLIKKIIMNISSYITLKKYQANKKAAVRQNTESAKSTKDKSLRKGLNLAIIMCFISIFLHILTSVVTDLNLL